MKFFRSVICSVFIVVLLAGCATKTVNVIPTEPTSEVVTTEKITEEVTTEQVTEEVTTEQITEAVTEVDTELVTEVVTEETTTVAPVEPTPIEPPAKEEIADGEVFTLTFVGDCTLGTMPKWMSHSLCFNRLIGDNYDLPFQYVRKVFEADDCTFVNLESVLAESGEPVEKTFTFMGPTAYVNILTGSSVEFANLSNNHSYDFGEAGYQSTKQTLDKNNVAYVEQNSGTIYTTKSGLTIGVYGVYFELNHADMVADVNVLKEQGAEVIVAAVHWGIEGAYTQNAAQTDIGHKLIDAGVDIVWGHHPHVLQPIEEYNGGIIYYSLGNFSFGGNHDPGDRDTAILQQRVIRDKDGNVSLGNLVVIPCALSSKSAYNDFQPVAYDVNSDAYKRVLRKLKW